LTFLLSILNLGIAARANFAETHVMPDVAGDVLYTLGFLVALLMWSFGLVWLVFALASIYLSKPFHFNMGWWGFTFPIGVYSINTITLGIEMPSMFFRVFGTVRRYQNPFALD
jgi:tellurite resistance protein TehA-like permease